MSFNTIRNRIKRQKRNHNNQGWQEGYEAAKAGKHIQSIPQQYIHTTNRMHWIVGYESYQPTEEEIGE